MLLNVIRQRLWQLFLNAGNAEDHESKGKGKGGREAIRNRNALERRQDSEREGEREREEIRRSRALQTKDLGNKLAAVWRSKK